MRINITMKGKLLRCPSIFPGCEVSVRCIQGREFPEFSDNGIGLYCILSSAMALVNNAAMSGIMLSWL